MGVLDHVCVLHHNSLTVKRGVAGINIQQYCQLADQGQAEFFTKKNLIKEKSFLKAEEIIELKVIT